MDRVVPGAQEVLRFEGLTLDLAGRVLLDGGGRDLRLTRSEFDLLAGLVRAPGRALSRDFLLEMVAGRRGEPFDRSIDVLIGRLRKKIEADPKSPRLIVTVAGSGYKLAAKLQPVQDDGRAALVEAETDRQRWPHSPERRQLTILLCGLAIQLPGQLDPEDLYHAILAFRRYATDVCAQCGGVVAQVRNDAVLAYFGYPQAHEHDAERAVRAGLAMIETAGKLESGLPAAPAVRVSIATGSVIVGDLLDDNAARVHAVLGEAPDLAARLLPAAAPGSVVIATSTKRLIGRLFDCRPLGRLVQDAGGEPTEAFQVLGEASVESRFEALREARLTRLVGREEEVALLLRRWARAREGAGRLVHITGEPGLGKSRLVRELRARIEGEAHLAISCFCTPHQQSTPLYPIIAHLERAARFAREDGPEAKRAKLEDLIGPSGAGEEDLALVADLLSLPPGQSRGTHELSPHQRRLKTLDALSGQLVRAAREQPVLFLFEDLHWIDPTSRELLESMVDRIGGQRVLFVVTSRPEFAPAWSSLAPTETMLLRRLDDGETAELVANVGGRRLTDLVCRRIVERADGVPLFAEELAKLAIERNPPPVGPGKPLPKGAAPDLSLPSSLHDSLMARLDRSAAAKEVAQLGAVIGRSFSYELIAALAPLSEPALHHALGQLVLSGLASRRGVPPQATYTFKHALLQNAAYESLLKSRRATIHGRLVDVLIAQEPSIEDSQPELLAHHCERAGRTENAANYYIHAGWRLNYRGAYKESGEQFANAIRLAATLPEGSARDLAELRALRGVGLTMANGDGYASSKFGSSTARAADLCERVDYPPEYAGIGFGLFTFYIHRSDLLRVMETAERLSRWGQTQNDIRGSILGRMCFGVGRMAQGELATARSHLQQALELYSSTLDDPTVVWTYRTAISRGRVWGRTHADLALISCWMGYPDQALAHISASDEQAEEEVLVVAEPLNLWQRLRVLSFLREPSELTAPAEKMAALSREHGLPQLSAQATIIRGYVIACCGDPETGRTIIGDGLATYTATEAVYWSCYFRALLAETHRMVGATDEALRILAETLDLTERTGERWYNAELHRRIGEVHRQRGAEAAAQLSFERALSVARDQPAKLWELQAATSFARLLWDQGKPAKAHALLSPVHDWFTEGLDTNPVRDARALLESLGETVSDPS